MTKRHNFHHFCICVCLMILISIYVVGGSSDESKKIISAREILETIGQNQSVDYNGVIIDGDLKLELDPMGSMREVYVPLNIRNCEIRGDIKFENVIFLEMVDFTNTNFSKSVNFVGSVFEGPAFFDEACFEKSARFGKAQFDRNANFRESRFYESALFERVLFHDIANFNGAFFFGKAEFAKAKFNNTASYWNTNFSRSSNFINSIFIDDAEFWGAQFVEDADFRNVIFNNYVYFNSYQVPFLMISEAKFDSNLSLDGAVIRKIQLDDVKFSDESRISLNNTDFEILFVRWDSIDEHLVYNDAVYLSLINNFKKLGYFDDADDSYYQYRKELMLRKGWKDSSKYTDILSWISFGYSVRWFRPIISGIVLIILFAGIFWKQEITRENSEKSAKNLSPVDTLYFSSMVFISQAPANWNPEGKSRFFVVLEGLFGWLLLGLFLVSLVNVMMR